MKLYHLDRVGTLVDGQRIELLPLTVLRQEAQNSDFLQDFSSGISCHGKRYLEGITTGVLFDRRDEQLISPSSIYFGKHDLDSNLIELVLELVRRKYFPNAQSRLTALFATNDLTYWEDILRKDQCPNWQIFELDIEKNLPQYDASWLKFGSSFENNQTEWWMGLDIIGCFDNACKYWSGELTDSPQPEYLVPLPTTPIHLLPHQV